MRTKKCKVKNCVNMANTRGLCTGHNSRYKKYGNLYIDIPLNYPMGARSLENMKKILQASSGWRYCQSCSKYKKIEDFGKGKLHNYVCKSCKKSIRLKSKYGISIKDYKKLLKKQRGRCALCGTKDFGKRNILFVDHNHRTGRVRGLLCNACNRNVIGMLEKREISISHLVKYLESS